MFSSKLNFKIIQLNNVVSTNIYAYELLQNEIVNEGTVIWSAFQEKGKGQRMNLWHSSAYKNLTFSLVAKPNLSIEKQFIISQKVALAIVKCLDRLSVGKVSIKWPNDILIDDRKVGGVLIENSLQGSKINTSIIGIGINVNETEFPEFDRKATSLKLESGRNFIIEELLHSLLNQIKNEFISIRNPQDEYLKRLYGMSDSMKFIDDEGEFTGTIVGVMPNGHLQLNKNGKLKNYENKSLKFLE